MLTSCSKVSSKTNMDPSVQVMFWPATTSTGAGSEGMRRGRCARSLVLIRPWCGARCVAPDNTDSCAE